MPLLRIGLADAEAQRELAVELGVREEEIAAAVQPFHDGLIRLVSTFVAEADQVQRYRGGQFEAGIIANLLCELLR